MMAQLAGDARAGSPRASSAAVPAAPAEPPAARDAGAPPSVELPGARAGAAAAPPAASAGAGGPEPAEGGGAQGVRSVREQDAADEVAVAHFLRSTPGLPRQLVRSPSQTDVSESVITFWEDSQCLPFLLWEAASVRTRGVCMSSGLLCTCPVAACVSVIRHMFSILNIVFTATGDSDYA